MLAAGIFFIGLAYAGIFLISKEYGNFSRTTVNITEDGLTYTLITKRSKISLCCRSAHQKNNKYHEKIYLPGLNHAGWHRHGFHQPGQSSK
jgi:hypothetical protein